MIVHRSTYENGKIEVLINDKYLKSPEEIEEILHRIGIIKSDAYMRMALMEAENTE